MKTIVLLCGTSKSGKTKTLKALFKVSHVRRLLPNQLLEGTINKTKILAVSLGSPQEIEKFCNIAKVEENISRRIQKCEHAYPDENYALIIPYGVYQKSRTDRELNEKCFLEPVEWLKTLGFKIIAVYIRKRTARLLGSKDSLIRKISKFEINSNKEYQRQAIELENYLKNEFQT